MQQEYKLGKLPFTLRPEHLRLGKYLNPKALPPLPKNYRYSGEIADSDWGMLLNDVIGDCVIAGMMHQIMVITEEGTGVPVKVTDADTLKIYRAITGYDPKRPETDRGTNPEVAYNYWLKNGLPDDQGSLHKIDAWIVVEYENMQALKYALYLFGTVGIGVNMPKSAMEQFKEGKTWTDTGDTNLLGGHYIGGVGYDSGKIEVVSWGKKTRVTEDFLVSYGLEVLLPVSKEMLDAQGITDEGFNWDQLMADLAEIPGVDPGPPPEDDPQPPPEPRYDVAELVLVIGSNVMTVYIGSNRDYILSTLDVPPEIEDGRTMLPVELIASYMGMMPTFDPEAQIVTLGSGDLTVTLTIGSRQMILQRAGEAAKIVDLDKAPYIKNGRTLCPIGLIAHAIGWYVTWRPEQPHVVRLKNPKIVTI